jgi:hypothetical protein
MTLHQTKEKKNNTQKQPGLVRSIYDNHSLLHREPGQARNTQQTRLQTRNNHTMGGNKERGIVREKKCRRKKIRHPAPDQIVAPSAMAREKARLEVRLNEIRLNKKNEGPRCTSPSLVPLDQPGPSGLQQRSSNPPSRASSNEDTRDSKPGTPPQKERESRSRTPVAKRLGGYVIPRRQRDDPKRTIRREEPMRREEPT